MSELDRQVIESLESGQFVSRNRLAEIEKKSTSGERTADKVAQFGGSWTFILLNFVLSCLAAMRAPVIRMSQGGQGTKDRLRAESDYRVNLPVELEIPQILTFS